MLKIIVFNLKFTFGQASCSLCSSHTVAAMWRMGQKARLEVRPPSGGYSIAWGGVEGGGDGGSDKVEAVRMERSGQATDKFLLQLTFMSALSISFHLTFTITL